MESEGETAVSIRSILLVLQFSLFLIRNWEKVTDGPLLSEILEWIVLRYKSRVMKAFESSCQSSPQFPSKQMGH